jgi:ribonucleases P/MRP protein subunit RPP40
VRIGFSVSSICPVVSGVPQGSVLGPILFIIYVNDMIHLWSPCTVSVKLFADDTRLNYIQFYITIPHFLLTTDLQSCLDAILEWSTFWQLKLAPTKCTVMRNKPRATHTFSCAPCAPCYHIGSVRLPVISNCTDLGVSCDANLSFTPHVSNIVAKASCRAKLILKCFSSRDALLLTRAFCTLVRIRILLHHMEPVYYF